MASSWAERLGSPHGNLGIQPSNPLPPRFRPAFSRAARIVKAVMRLGKKIPKVMNRWSVFICTGMPGSVYWWWKPVGMDRIRKMMNTTRTKLSENSLPPACLGTMVYHDT